MTRPNLKTFRARRKGDGHLGRTSLRVAQRMTVFMNEPPSDMAKHTASLSSCRRHAVNHMSVSRTSINFDVSFRPCEQSSGGLCGFTNARSVMTTDFDGRLLQNFKKHCNKANKVNPYNGLAQNLPPTPTAKHHQVKTKTFLPHSRCVPTYIWIVPNWTL